MANLLKLYGTVYIYIYIYIYKRPSAMFTHQLIFHLSAFVSQFTHNWFANNTNSPMNIYTCARIVA